MDSTATNRNFIGYLIFWIGQLFSILGSSIIHFVIVWWITVITGSAVMLGVANFLGMLPLIVLTPIFGVFIDKWNRKIIIAIADFCQALITFWIIMLFFLGIEAVIPIILINSLRGVCQAFHFPTVKAIIPIMVPKDKLSRMNAIDYLFNGIVHIAGPVIAAILLAFIPIIIILWIDILTFAIAIIPLLIIKIPLIIQDKVEKKQFSFSKDFKLGLDGLKQVPGLVILLVLISVINFLGQPFGTLLPLFVSSNHFGDASDLAVVMVLMQIGMIIGAVIASSKKDWKNRVMVISSCISISVIGYVISALSPTGNFILIGIGGMIRAGMVPLINTNFLTIVQLNVPPEKQGKVMSIVVSLAWAVIPLGSLVSGPIAETIGIVPLYLTFAFLEILTVITILLATNVRKVRYETIYDSKINDKNVELEPNE
ncbi:MAG: MFS transporter [Candidatus Lokiarchaeota archaeon]|nr:MFS transporter [Candidatus Lokiarchaeota archaeon]